MSEDEAEIQLFERFLKAVSLYGVARCACDYREDKHSPLAHDPAFQKLWGWYIRGEPREAEPFECPHCGARSWHPEDKKQGYCARCNWWTDPEKKPLLARPEVVEKMAKERE